MTTPPMEEQVARVLAERWLGRMAHRLSPDDERQKVDNIWQSFAPDAAAILAIPAQSPDVEGVVKALEENAEHVSNAVGYSKHRH